MRHGVKTKKLGRTHSHRKALINNMIKSFVKSEKIITTVEKAKILRTAVEKIITRSKNDTISNRRFLFSCLGCKITIAKLFEDLGKRYAQRNGGYTRIFKLYNRKGDNATMALIELVEEELVKKSSKNSQSNQGKKSASKIQLETIEVSSSHQTLNEEQVLLTDQNLEKEEEIKS